MKEKIFGLQINEKDNVAVAFGNAGSGTEITVKKPTGENMDYVIYDEVSYGHKIALRDIASGENIIKYGEVIGRATADIKKGGHVHVENVESLRGRGDLA